MMLAMQGTFASSNLLRAKGKEERRKRISDIEGSKERERERERE